MDNIENLSYLIEEMIEEKVNKAVKAITEKMREGNNDELLTRKEALSLLKTSDPTLNKWVKEGYLKKICLGKRVMYRKKEVLDFRIKGTQTELELTDQVLFK